MTRAQLLARVAATSRSLAGVTVADAVSELIAQGAVVPDNLADEVMDYGNIALANVAIFPKHFIEFLIDWFDAQRFCPGPPPSYAFCFSQAPDLDAANQFRFRPEFGPVYYRGRLDGTARLLVVGQDPSSDEQLANRSFVGLSGQRLQRFIEKLGLTSSYVIVNTFHLGVKSTYNSELRQVSKDPVVKDWRNSLLDKLKAENSVEALLTVGTAAKEAVNMWPGRGALPKFHLQHPAHPDHAQTLGKWNTALDAMGATVTPDAVGAADLAHYGATWTAADSSDIPRLDLPFGTPPWHGTGGVTKSGRNGADSIEWTR